MLLAEGTTLGMEPAWAQVLVGVLLLSFIVLIWVFIVMVLSEMARNARDAKKKEQEQAEADEQYNEEASSFHSPRP
jgi:lysylphosphatidylglycerol synthetase-like protein (DUF2156 family)